MFGQINHTAEIATCAYFFGFQRADKVNRNYFSSVENDTCFPQEMLLGPPRLTGDKISPCVLRVMHFFHIARDYLGMGRKCAQYKQ